MSGSTSRAQLLKGRSPVAAATEQRPFAPAPRTLLATTFRPSPLSPVSSPLTNEIPQTANRMVGRVGTTRGVALCVVGAELLVDEHDCLSIHRNAKLPRYAFSGGVIFSRG